MPDDISVLAVASSRVATAVHPRSARRRCPPSEMGRQAVETLLRLLASASAPLAHILLSPPFEDRGSVAGPRRSHAQAARRGHRPAPWQALAAGEIH